MVLTLAVTWGSSATISALSGEIDAVLKNEPVSWSNIYTRTDELIDLTRRRVSASRSCDPGVFNGLGKNTMVLLSLRWSDSDRTKLYREEFSRYRGSDSTILSFVQYEAVKDLFAVNGDAERAVSLIEHCYAENVQIYSQSSYHPSRIKMSNTTAKAILKNSQKFPSFLVNIAEESLRAEIGGRAQPVSNVAKGQRWFQ